MFDDLKKAAGLGLLRNLDLYFAREIFRLDASSNVHLMLPAALASRAIKEKSSVTNEIYSHAARRAGKRRW